MDRVIDSAWLTKLRQQLQTSGQRRLLLLAGTAQWGRARLQQIAHVWGGAWLWAGGGDPLFAAVARKPSQVLGGEWDAVVIDGWAGVRPDLLGAASGALRGGGLLVVLTPLVAEWHSHRDPEYDRWASAGLQPLPGTRFWQRLRRYLDHPAVLVWEEHRAPPGLPARALPAWPGPQYTEQQIAVTAVLRCGQGRARRPLVVMADRGRGKSSALGLAAAELIRGGARVVATAPRLDACERLFQHAADALGLARISGYRLRAGGELLFQPVDELLNALESGELCADLLLVDEAAALPVASLRRLLAHPRVVFATTIHGYEGSGHGFERRFLPLLAQSHPQWQRVTLEEPLRWAPADPLEAWTREVLLLDAEPPAPVAQAAPVQIAQITQDALADETLLRQLFGLLVQAHYRTSPDDLRDLLDGSNLEVWVARRDTRPVGVLLAAIEGPLPVDLHEPILLGERRLRGHLLPQSLAFHGGEQWALAQRWRRVVRIAVTGPQQRQGVGRQLVEAVAAATASQGDELLGTSFAASAPLIRFWTRLGFSLLRVGTHATPAGGTVPVMMGRALASGAADQLEAAATRCRAQLPLQFCGPLRQLDPAIVRALLQSSTPARLLAQDELRAFARGKRPIDSCLGPLQQWALARLAAAMPLVEADTQLVAGRLLQFRPLSVLARRTGLAGAAAIETRLRALVAGSLHDLAD